MTGVPSIKRAFVTGATGGIGSVLCERLASEGWQIVALARPGSRTSHIRNLPGVSLVTHDLLDATGLTELMRGCDVVFHLAAMVHAPANSPRSAFQKINVDGTRVVVAAAVASRVRAFILFSSVAVYPESDDWMDESSAVAPSTPYGSTKLAAEQLALEKRDQIRVTVLRLPVVYSEWGGRTTP